MGCTQFLANVNYDSTEETVNDYDTVIFDLDGVVWQGNKPFPFSKRILEDLQQTHNVLFVTNNSSKSRAVYKQRFDKLLGLQVKTEQIVSTSYSVTQYMLKHVEKTKKIFVIGEQGLFDELGNAGFETIDGCKPGLTSIPEISKLNLDDEIGGVAFGFTTKFNYSALALATRLVQEKQIPIIFAAPDTRFKTAHGMLPSSGCVRAFLECALDRPVPHVGKPNAELLAGFNDLGRCLMVGDNLDTDVRFGVNCGLDTLLVLSGVSSRDDVARSDVKPTYIADTIADFFESKQNHGAAPPETVV